MEKMEWGLARVKVAVDKHDFIPRDATRYKDNTLERLVTCAVCGAESEMQCAEKQSRTTAIRNYFDRMRNRLNTWRAYPGRLVWRIKRHRQVKAYERRREVNDG
jgi:hypothetical protein